MQSSFVRKLFVLDTNVLLHDPSSLFRFEEHDLFIPMVVLEELDRCKKGLTDTARNARQSSRFLDELISQTDLSALREGVPLSRLENAGIDNVASSGRLFFRWTSWCRPCPSSFRAIFLIILFWLQRWP